MALCPSGDGHAAEDHPPLPAPGASAPRRRVSVETERKIENWIVGVVTLVSAGVILVSILTHRDPAAPAAQASSAAAAVAVHP